MTPSGEAPSARVPLRPPGWRLHALIAAATILALLGGTVLVLLSPPVVHVGLDYGGSAARRGRRAAEGGRRRGRASLPRHGGGVTPARRASRAVRPAADPGDGQRDPGGRLREGSCRGLVLDGRACGGSDRRGELPGDRSRARRRLRRRLHALPPGLLPGRELELRSHATEDGAALSDALLGIRRGLPRRVERGGRAGRPVGRPPPAPASAATGAARSLRQLSGSPHGRLTRRPPAARLPLRGSPE